MAVQIDLSILGDKVLEKRLKALPLKVQKKILRKAFRSTAKDILSDARIRVPIDTGNLRKSLRVRALKKAKGRIGVQIETGTREELGIDENDKYYYPAAIELGAEGVPVQSFLRAALEVNRVPGTDKIKKSIMDGIKEAGKS